MKSLFKENGEPSTPNGKWIEKMPGIRVYEYYCCSKKHTFQDPDEASKCCMKEFTEYRRLDQGWFEKSLFTAS